MIEINETPACEERLTLVLTGFQVYEFRAFIDKAVNDLRFGALVEEIKEALS